MSENKGGPNGGSYLPSDVRKAGMLKKLKTMKKKYFVLRTATEVGPARLEYYDSEKKFKAGGGAKRTIPLNACFSINRKIDAKQKLAIALYTNDDCFSVVAETEASLEEWFHAMLELQLDKASVNGGAKLKPKFDHVWQVNMGEKSLASSRNMKGPYRLCLTSSSLTLIKVDQSDCPETLEFPLMSIRRCGHTNNYFVIELGRSSIIGAGELWLETEDGVIAQNMHEVTLSAMKSCREHEDLGPLARPRSASNSENSRPIVTRRPVAIVSPQTISYGGIRDRCDSMPSRPRTISEGQEVNNRSYYAPPSYMLDSLRPHGSYSRTVSYSPPGLPNPLSPMSANCSTDSAGSSLSIDEFDAGQQSDFAHGRYCHSLPTDGALHTEPTIKEEQIDDYVPMVAGMGTTTPDGYMHMAPMSASAPSAPPVFLNLNPEGTGGGSGLPTSQNNDYMEMKSPTEGYVNMNIGANTEARSKSCSAIDSPVNDAAPTVDGYIHMAPLRNQNVASPPVQQQNEPYVDMNQLSSSLPKTLSVSNHSVGTSSQRDSNTKLSEVTSSSPTSTNLQDFPLEKVKSLLTDTDDTSSDYIRPVRAYSMGSRPQPKKPHLPVQVDGSRIRAYSVGSQAASAHRKFNNPLDRELGSLKLIDPRTGAKSSSAPLLNNRPPRIRSSASRGDVGEDLMEIDYNKTRYSSSGADFCDANFTIEPVGRSRSGSYSSSTNTALKVLHDQDKVKSHSTGHNCTATKESSESVSDYLTMSPLKEHTKPNSKASASSEVESKTRKQSVVKAEQVAVTKKPEYLHPPGDYVSLDPNCTYQATTGSSQLNSYLVTNQSYISDNTKGASLPQTNDSNPISHNAGSSDVPEKAKSVNTHLSDYMCMDYTKKDEPTQNNHSSKKIESPKQGDIKAQKKPKAPLSPPSPFSKSPSPQMSPMENFVPKTPPPSPYYGATPTSSSPLMETVVRRLSQPFEFFGRANNNSRPNSICNELQLNYASLDLPPSSDEDRPRKPVDGETKEAPLAYAEIDFSPMRKNALQETESLSHL